MFPTRQDWVWLRPRSGPRSPPWSRGHAGDAEGRSHRLHAGWVSPPRGRDIGEIVILGFGEAESTPEFAAGDRVVLYDLGGNARLDRRYQFADRERRPVLLFVTLAFALAVVALGRWRGLASLAGLAISVVVLTVFIIPSILSGRPATLVAVVGAAAIAYSALYLAHGFKPLTHVALLGTLGALALTVALSALVTALAELSGFASEEALLVSQLGATVDVSGLILAGIVLGAVGALDDVTVTQTSAVWELRLANPALNGRPLLRAALRVGRDHVVSSVNTLLLAYAGAAIPLLILFSLSDLGLGTVANSEIVATEIIRTLVGSIGLVATVPITTWLASEVAARSRIRSYDGIDRTRGGNRLGPRGGRHPNLSGCATDAGDDSASSVSASACVTAATKVASRPIRVASPQDSGRRMGRPGIPPMDRAPPRRAPHLAVTPFLDVVGQVPLGAEAVNQKGAREPNEAVAGVRNGQRPRPIEASHRGAGGIWASRRPSSTSSRRAHDAARGWPSEYGPADRRR